MHRRFPVEPTAQQDVTVGFEAGCTGPAHLVRAQPQKVSIIVLECSLQSPCPILQVGFVQLHLFKTSLEIELPQYPAWVFSRTTIVRDMHIQCMPNAKMNV